MINWSGDLSATSQVSQSRLIICRLIPELVFLNTLSLDIVFLDGFFEFDATPSLICGTKLQYS